MADGVFTTELMMNEVSGVSKCGGVKKIMFLCPAREGFLPQSLGDQPPGQDAGRVADGDDGSPFEVRHESIVLSVDPHHGHAGGRPYGQ